MSSKANNPLAKFEETWVNIYPKCPSQIRVFSNHFYHHAIYLADDNVIQFGDGDFINVPEVKNIVVNRTTLNDFCNQKTLEVRSYSKKERKHLKKNAEILVLAEAGIGESNYDFIHNNCEHFSNECFFGFKYSSQIDSVRKKIGGAIK